jgi:hypothetical protein
LRFGLPAVEARFRFAVEGFAVLDGALFARAAVDVRERAVVAFFVVVVVVFVGAARFVDAADDFALDRRGADDFLPPSGSASLTALTAALAASPTVSTTFPAVFPACLPTAPAVLPACLPTAPAVLPACLPTAPAVLPTVFTTSPG